MLCGRWVSDNELKQIARNWKFVKMISAVGNKEWSECIKRTKRNRLTMTKR